MERFKRLVQKAENEGCRLLVTYVPSEDGEEWCVKYYPDAEESDHYYAYHSQLELAAHQVLDELRNMHR